MPYIPRKKATANSSFKKKTFTRSPRAGSSSSSYSAGSRPTSRSASTTGRTYTPRTPNKPAFGASSAPRTYTPRKAPFGAAPAARTYPPRRGASAPFRGKVTAATAKPADAAPFPQKPPYRPGQSASRPTTRTAAPRTSEEKKSVAPKPPRTISASYEPKNPTTSWGEVADWYDAHLAKGDTYHEKVILPNLLRLVDPKRTDAIVDLACGTGYFTQALAKEGAKLTGIDIGEELIAIARKASPAISYHVSSAEKIGVVEDNTKDKVVIVLAIQNIERPQNVFAEAARILKAGGTFHLVMNHPAFRIPKQSSWEYDDKKKVQFRRLDQYMSESSSMIEMHPGMKETPTTISFHRPLQYYFKALAKVGFAVDRLEEWISHKTSDSGPRARAENAARKEIPLFLYLRAQKIGGK